MREITGDSGGGALAARLLRGLGAAVLVASLSVFLFQGWSEAGDLGRYGLLLAQTVVLMAAGFACVHWLREPKGARVFVAVALVAVVANFAVLGALLWSRYQWLGSFGTYPEAMVWRAVSGAWVLGLTAASVPLLAGVSRIGFTILARHSARSLTALFLASCAVLLVPVREPWSVAVLSTLVVAAFAYRARRGIATDPALRTLEGGFALCLPLLPAGVALGRGVLFYAGEDLLFAAGCTLAFLGLREVSRSLVDHARWGARLDRAGAVAAILAGLAWAEVALWVRGLGAEAFLPVFGLVAGGLILEVSWRAWRAPAAFRLLAAGVASVPVAANVLLTDSLGAAVSALAVGIAVAALAVTERRLWLLAVAGLATLAGLGELVALAVDSVRIGAWGWLAVIGSAAVLAGSALERFDWRDAADRWRGNAGADPE